MVKYILALAAEEEVRDAKLLSVNCFAGMLLFDSIYEIYHPLHFTPFTMYV